MQTNDRSVCCRMCFPSGVHSFASPNGFYSVYALMYSLYSVCGSQRFLFCLSSYLFSEWCPQFCKPQRFLFCLRLDVFSVPCLWGTNGFYSVYRRICFSEWHIVPQLYIQIKQSRVYSRKALAGWKASRRLGKQIRGLSRFLSKPTLQQFFL